MGMLQDLSGQIFGRWTVLRRSESDRRGKPFWLCRCSCGTERDVSGSSLRAKKSTSCGCLRRETTTRHGLSLTPEYRSWNAMWHRCTNPRDKCWALYGGRGIAVCEQWKDPRIFLDDMGHRPSIHHTLERNNVNSDYSPDNCRWALSSEQASNRRNNLWCSIEGSRMIAAQAARMLGVHHSTVAKRIHSGQLEMTT